MLLKELLKHYQNEFASFSETPDIDAQVLMCHALKRDKAFLFREPKYQLTADELAHFESLCKRRLTQEPIAYITGSKSFWDLDLNVTPDTLIPRPETECLIEHILAAYDADTALTVVDMGTGTGAIALVLKRERPNWTIYAVDQSQSALSVAAANANTYQLSIHWICSNWFAELPNIQFDLIISNPPYIDKTDPSLDALSFEPLSALVAEEEGFSDLEHLIQQAHAYLKPGGALVLEHGAEQQDTLVQILTENRYKMIHKGQDYAAKPRFLFSKYT